MPLSDYLTDRGKRKLGVVFGCGQGRTPADAADAESQTCTDVQNRVRRPG
ncbi:MAG TPA: hypothetical protein VHL09_17100 [Dehalococcoidia bacterium]|nr:hypothetical protein [Dehalococcoidia bacterium]